MSYTRKPYNAAGYSLVKQSGGAALPPRSILRAGAGVTFADDAATDTTTITASGSPAWPGPASDLLAADGSLVAVGAGLVLSAGTIAALAPWPGTAAQLLAADGSTVAIGSGLTLSAGVIAATGGGGISELTGDVTAGPGAGSQAATVRGITGAPGGVLAHNRVALVDYGYLQLPSGYVPLEWDGSNNRLRIGSLDVGGYGQMGTVTISPQSLASMQLINAAPSVSAAKMNTYGALASLGGGLQQTTHARLTGGATPYQCDDVYHPNPVDFYLECAFAAGSGGQTIAMPATPWPATLPNSPGRTIIIADVLGTCSTPDAIVLTDPVGRTFNQTPGPYTIDKPSNVCTATLDSTLNNWILSFAHGSPF